MRSLQESTTNDTNFIDVSVSNFTSSFFDTVQPDDVFFVSDNITGWNNESDDAWSDTNNSTTTTGNSTAAGNDNRSESQILVGTLYTYGIAFTMCFLLLCWARRRFPRAFNLRSWVDGRKTDLAMTQYGFFSWIWQLHLIDDERLMRECGMDSVSFVRICSMGLKLATMGILCGFFLVPVYYTAPKVDETRNVTDTIVKMTTGNVGPGDSRLVSTALASYVFFGFAMYLILTELEQWFIPLRHKFHMSDRPRNYAVFVRNIPHQYRSNAGLEYFFSRCLGVDMNHIEAHIGLTTKDLQAAVARRDATVRKLERALAEKDILGLTPTHKVQAGPIPGVPVPGLGETVDSIDYYAKQLKEQNKDITERINNLVHVADQSLNLTATRSLEEGEEDDGDGMEHVSFFSFLQQSAVSTTENIRGGAEGLGHLAASGIDIAANLVTSGEDGETLSGGLVVFKKLSEAQAALQMIHHEHPFSMEVLDAPDPEDVCWENVGLHHKQLQLGMLASFGLTSAMCLFWTIPVSFVAGLSSVEALREGVPFIDDMCDALPFLVPLLEILAPQFLIILDSLLPLILGYISSFEGLVSGSLLETSLFQKLAAFMIIQTFFVSALSGSVLKELEEILDNPTTIVDLLARSLPAQSTFFLQMGIVQTVTTFAIEGLRIVDIALAIVRRFVGPNLTHKERHETYIVFRPLNEDKGFEMAEYTSTLVFFFMILLVYSVIAPLVTIVLAGCFVVMGTLFRHQFVYIYTDYPDSGGAIWVLFIQIITKCLLIAEITIFGLLALKRSIFATPLMLPLIIITVLFQCYINQKHWHVASRLPSRKCFQRDRINEDRDLRFFGPKYIQPELRKRIVLLEDASPEIDTSPERLEQLGLGAEVDAFGNANATAVGGGIGCRVIRLLINEHRSKMESATGQSSATESENGQINDEIVNGESCALIVPPRPPVYDEQV